VSSARHEDGAAASVPVRAIDVPIEELPTVDEHSIEVGACQQDTWESIIPVLRRAFSGPLAQRIARMLGCAETQTAGDPRHPGATLPGFIVARAVPPTLYALLGAHRFSAYSLVLQVDRLGPRRSRVRAQTRAEFPGAAGRMYRILVVGTRVHVLVIHRLLRGIRRRSETIETATGGN
jgi:hypothetical protein